MGLLFFAVILQFLSLLRFDLSGMLGGSHIPFVAALGARGSLPRELSGQIAVGPLPPDKIEARVKRIADEAGAKATQAAQDADCSAAPCRNASCGAPRWMRCGTRSICAKSPRCAGSTRKCATSTASGCWITPSIRIRHRRAPVSSSPRISPNGLISRHSWRWRAATSRHCRRKESSFASTV
jgi:hypothetical protein